MPIKACHTLPMGETGQAMIIKAYQTMLIKSK